MAQKGTSILVEAFQIRFREEAHRRQRGIEGQGGVALAEDAEIPAGPFRLAGTVTQEVGIEYRQNVRHGQHRADMAGTGAVGALDALKPDPVGEGFAVHVDLSFIFIVSIREDDIRPTSL